MGWVVPCSSLGSSPITGRIKCFATRVWRNWVGQLANLHRLHIRHRFLRHRLRQIRWWWRSNSRSKPASSHLRTRQTVRLIYVVLILFLLQLSVGFIISHCLFMFNRHGINWRALHLLFFFFFVCFSFSAGSCDFGPATLPRSYKGFGMGSSMTLAGAVGASTSVETKKPHVTWSDTMPKAFRQSHDFLRRETSSSSTAANKRESVV